MYLMAGLIVGLVALPLAIAFAIASGVSPGVARLGSLIKFMFPIGKANITNTFQEAVERSKVILNDET
jgi:hypothetical protein